MLCTQFCVLYQHTTFYRLYTAFVAHNFLSFVHNFYGATFYRLYTTFYRLYTTFYRLYITFTLCALYTILCVVPVHNFLSFVHSICSTQLFIVCTQPLVHNSLPDSCVQCVCVHNFCGPAHSTEKLCFCLCAVGCLRVSSIFVSYGRARAHSEHPPTASPGQTSQNTVQPSLPTPQASSPAR